MGKKSWRLRDKSFSFHKNFSYRNGNVLMLLLLQLMLPTRTIHTQIAKSEVVGVLSVPIAMLPLCLGMARTNWHILIVSNTRILIKADANVCPAAVCSNCNNEGMSSPIYFVQSINLFPVRTAQAHVQNCNQRLYSVRSDLFLHMLLFSFLCRCFPFWARQIFFKKLTDTIYWCPNRVLKQLQWLRSAIIYEPIKSVLCRTLI